MNFEFECGWCGADNVLWGKPKGFWTESFELPMEWDCWWCEGTNVTPPPPWTEAA